MADTEIAVTYTAKNTATTTPAGVSVATGNTAVITPAAGKPLSGRYLVVRAVESGTGSSSTVSFAASPTGGTPSNQGQAGPVVFELAADADRVVQVELSRVLQSNGTVRATVSGTNAAVTFSAVQSSKNA